MTPTTTMPTAGREQAAPPPTPAASASIGDLVQRMTDTRAGDAARQRAFGEVVRRFQDMAYGCALALLGGDAHLAEDAAQESFLAAWRQIDNLRDPEAFPGWFKQIVRTQCSRMTRGKRLPTVSWEQSPAAVLAVASPNRAADPYRRAADAERDALLHGALAALPEHERIAALLYYLGDHDQAEVAAFLGVPTTTVKKRLFSARRRLRERIAPYMDTEGEAPMPEIAPAAAKRRPSNDDRFARTVEFWRALDDNDVAAVEALLAGGDVSLTAARDPRGTTGTPLHVAADCGYAGVVAALLAAGADANAARERDGATPLHALAAGSASAETAESLLDAGADVNAHDRAGRTPLHVAALAATPFAEDDADRWALCALLIAKGASVDAHSAAALDRADELARLCAADPSVRDARTPDTGETPLHVAARAGYRQAIKALLAAGADVEAKDARERTPLHAAASPGRARLLPPNATAVQLLRGAGAEVDAFAATLLNDTARLEQLLAETPASRDARDADGATPLMLAAWHGSRGALEHLLERGADVAATDKAGRTAASVRWRPEDVDAASVDLLLAAGAKTEPKTMVALGRSVPPDPDLLAWAIEVDLPTERIAAAAAVPPRSLHQAAALGAEDVARRLLDEDPAAVRGRDARRRTPLHHAAGRGQAGTVSLLLAAGADPNAQADDGETPLHHAARGGHLDAARRLLDAGADAALRSHRGEGPLFAAACSSAAASGSAAELVDLLLQRGASAREAGKGKNTPLHVAAEHGREEVVARLLTAGGDANARNYYGATPLHVAARAGHAEAARRLLGSGAEMLARDDWYRTPLHVAVWFDRPDVCELLLDAGIAVSELSYGFSTPLHTAAERGSRRVAELLIERGADVDAASDFGRTPLHDAVHGDQYDVAALLLERGANPSAANNRKQTPLHWAAAGGRADLVRLLLSFGADRSARSHKNETPEETARRYGHAGVIALLRAA